MFLKIIITCLFLAVVNSNYNSVQGIKFAVENNVPRVRVGHSLQVKCDATDYLLGNQDCIVYFYFGKNGAFADFYIQGNFFLKIFFIFNIYFKFCF